MVEECSKHATVTQYMKVMDIDKTFQEYKYELDHFNLTSWIDLQLTMQ